MKHNRVFSIAVFSLTVVSCATPSSPNNKQFWQQRIGQVSVGMPRSQVEQILTPQAVSPYLTIIQGGSQVTAYWVDQFWKVLVSYDYTGIPGDDSGTPLLTRAENKLLVLPTLVREDMPTPINMNQSGTKHSDEIEITPVSAPTTGSKH